MIRYHFINTSSKLVLNSIHLSKYMLIFYKYGKLDSFQMKKVEPRWKGSTLIHGDDSHALFFIWKNCPRVSP